MLPRLFPRQSQNQAGLVGLGELQDHRSTVVCVPLYFTASTTDDHGKIGIQIESNLLLIAAIPFPRVIWPCQTRIRIG